MGVIYVDSTHESPTETEISRGCTPN